MADNLQLKLTLKAFDGMSNVIKSACHQSSKEFEAMNKKLEETAGKFNDVGKKAAMFGGALTAVSGVNLKFAGDFEEGMNNISTLIDTNVEDLKAMGQEVLNIAKGSPKGINDLTQGLYSIRSAGISASDAMGVLKGAEMVSVVGLSSTAEAVDVITSSINAFNISGDKQNKLYDTLFKYVKQGKTNISELAQGFGSVAGVVASTGIELDEYLASVAAMTTTGLKANNAHTQMSAAISSLTRGSKEQAKIFNQLGAKSFKDLVAKSGGMVNAFKRIDKAVSGDTSKMVELMGSINGYKAVLVLTNTVNAKYIENLDLMRNGGSWLEEGYNKQINGFNAQMKILKNNFQKLSIEFGNALLPIVKAAAGGLEKITDVIGRMPDGLKSFIGITTAGIGAVSLFSGTSLIAIGGILNGLVQLRKAARAIKLFSLLHPAIMGLMGPIGITTALIAGLAAGAVYCYNKFEGFRNMCQGLWAVIKATGAWLSVLGQYFITGAIGIWNFIKPAVKAAGVIFMLCTPIGRMIGLCKILFDLVNKLAQKFGGWRAIGENAKNFWENSAMDAQALNAEIKNSRKTNKQTAGDNKINGSHSNGLDYVPFNGYIAELHQGKRIQTRKEADLFRQGLFAKNNQNNVTVEYKPVINITGNMSEQEHDDFMKLLKNHKDEIVRLVSSTLARQEARAY